MSNRLAMLAMTGLHRVVLRLTGGRVGASLGRMRVIELVTRGRKSGAERRAILTVPVVETTEAGETLVVVASRGGDDLMPSWYLNLVADPEVGVASAAGGDAMPYRARTANDTERARLWPLAVRAYSGYAAYQRRTRRTIPLVLLEPEPQRDARRDTEARARTVGEAGSEPGS
ncbi:nitroreductase/quinone reductase family protein [Yonghaparkia sp. Root332]|uniref:nitroreductase/quinone reductase family protein n=1 Tax=Yonghaparkia sp. Root332 TaxID=1736516 RepID=UPI0009EA883A|nr:nitroreductase/quinone reductase family protein [Yonghaparkia sp. Root332]